MRTKYFRHSSIILLAASALSSLCIVLAPVDAQEIPEQILMFAPCGLAPGQGVRLNLFIPAGTNASAQVRVFDRSDAQVAESPVVRISGGEFHSFHLNPVDIDLVAEESNGRRQVRASCWVRLDTPWARIEEIAATLEIMQVSSGITDGMSTTLLVSERSSRAPDDNIVDLQDFVIGQVVGQSLRFNAFIVPDSTGDTEPIRMHAKVYDKNNDIIAVSREIQIQPGEFGEVSFNYSDLGIEGEPGTGRKQGRIKPFYEFRSHRLVRILGSYELVDNNTGASRIYLGFVSRFSSGR